MREIKHKTDVIVVVAGDYTLEDTPTTTEHLIEKVSCKPVVVELEDRPQGLRRLNLRLRSKLRPLGGSTEATRNAEALVE